MAQTCARALISPLLLGITICNAVAVPCRCVHMHHSGLWLAAGVLEGKEGGGVRRDFHDFHMLAMRGSRGLLLRGGGETQENAGGDVERLDENETHEGGDPEVAALEDMLEQVCPFPESSLKRNLSCCYAGTWCCACPVTRVHEEAIPAGLSVHCGCAHVCNAVRLLRP